MREVERAYMREPSRLLVSHRSEFLVEWINVLLEASAEVEAIFAAADEYRRTAGEYAEDDESYREAMRHQAAARWQSA